MSDHEPLHDIRRELDKLDVASQPIIELERIPCRLWERTLAPLQRYERFWVASQIADEKRRKLAQNLATELDMAECGRRRAGDEARLRASRTGAPLPTPDAEHAVLRSTVQLNIRLRRDDHARLTQAAASVGLKPTTLARALVLNGAAKIVRERAT